MATIGFFFKKKKKFAQLPEFIYFLTSSEPVICLEYFVDFLNKVKFSFSTKKKKNKSSGPSRIELRTMWYLLRGTALPYGELNS